MLKREYTNCVTGWLAITSQRLGPVCTSVLPHLSSEGAMMKWPIGRIWTLRPVVRHTVSNVRVARHTRHIAGRLYAKRIEPYIKLVFRFFIWWRNSLRALSYPVAET